MSSPEPLEPTEAGTFETLLGKTRKSARRSKEWSQLGKAFQVDLPNDNKHFQSIKATIDFDSSQGITNMPTRVRRKHTKPKPAKGMDDYLTTREAAKYMNKCMATVRKYIKEGHKGIRLAADQIGDEYRTTKRRIDEFTNQCNRLPR